MLHVHAKMPWHLFSVLLVLVDKTSSAKWSHQMSPQRQKRHTVLAGCEWCNNLYTSGTASVAIPSCITLPVITIVVDVRSLDTSVLCLLKLHVWWRLWVAEDGGDVEADWRGAESTDSEAWRRQHRFTVHVQTINYSVWSVFHEPLMRKWEDQ